ncbi:MAG: hypothetical protein IJ794_03795 [Lachnospiraceae bacterium]|nr:hypothetical protein [Lachnospiraceae bacterium]
MTVKALKKQLMAAIAMVVVSAIALSSSTYAWFVQSSQVTADGMKVQAVAESGIEITHASSGTWGSVATSEAATGLLYPTSTNNVVDWYHAKANASTAKDAIINTYENLTLDETAGTDAGGKRYFLLDQFTIRSADVNGTATALTIDSVVASTTGGNSALLNKSLRVAIVITGDVTDTAQNVHIYAPNGGDTSYTIWDGDDAESTPAHGPSVDVTANNGTVPESTAVSVSHSGVVVKIYAWYEGEDAELKSVNIPASTIDTMNLTVKFSATV